MKFLKVFKDTLPIFISYFALSFSFGILAVKRGINPYVAISMSICIYSGSLQFLLLMIYNKLTLLDIFITSFLLNFRQFFYSLSFLDRYKNHFYKIFTLTDETFAILIHQKENPKYDLYVSIFNHFYWVFGTICGIIFAQLVNFELKGLDFILVSLFVVILIENILKTRNIFPVLLGSIVFFIFYLLEIKNILIFSIVCSFFIIYLRRRHA